MGDFLSSGFGYGEDTSSSASTSSPFINDAGITFGNEGGVSGISSTAGATSSTSAPKTASSSSSPNTLAGTTPTLVSPYSQNIGGISTTIWLLIGAAIVAIVIIKKKAHA